MKKYKVLKEYYCFRLQENIEAGRTVEYCSSDYIGLLVRGGYIEEVREVKRSRFIPEDGGKYWSVYGDGTIQGDTFYTTSTFDARCLTRGNCYRTEEDAQRAVDKQRLLVEIQDFADEYNGDWVADWGDREQWKRSFFYDCVEECWEVVYVQYSFYYAEIYFKDDDFLKPLLEKFEDRMNELLLPVDNGKGV